MERESRTVEWKEIPNKSYLKTVSAFANYETGKIYFGINDQGERVGLPDPNKTILDLENQINDNLTPNPNYRFWIEDSNIVVLEVEKGPSTPYCYRGKAYKRNDTSDIEVSEIEFRNLAMKGKNLTYTELPCDSSNLHFSSFAESFKNRFDLEPAFPDIFITLELFSKDEGFTNGALLLSDENTFPGIDVVVFGDNRHEINQREILENMSVLEQLKRAEMLFLQNYQYETVDGFYREVKERIPARVFRELTANALVHREWQIPARIRIEMFKDGIRIISPGGLPSGISPEEYLSNHHISVFRNKSIALIFYKLSIIESLGTGIPMILETYKNNWQQPDFSITENMISVFVPLIGLKPDVSPEEERILHLVASLGPVSSTVLQKQTNISRSTVIRILNHLVKQGLVQKTGRARSVRYQKAP